MGINAHTALAFSTLLFLCGIVLGLWPVAYAGVLLAAVSGRYASALVLACVLDLIYGAPTGAWHSFAFPFVSITLLVVLAQAFLIRHLRESGVY